MKNKFEGVEALAESVREARRCSVLLKHAALSDSILAVLDRCAQHQRFSVPRSVCYPSVREALRSVPAGDGPPPAGEGDGQQLQGERASSKGGGKF